MGGRGGAELHWCKKAEWLVCEGGEERKCVPFRVKRGWCGGVKSNCWRVGVVE